MSNSLENSRHHKGSKVPYMGCQSLYYQNRINKSLDPSDWLPDDNPNGKSVLLRRQTMSTVIPKKYSHHPTDNDTNHHHSIPTGVLIHQYSPQSIRSFSTFHSDNTARKMINVNIDIDDDDIDSMEDIDFQNDSEFFGDTDTQLDGTIYDTPPTECNTICTNNSSLSRSMTVPKQYSPATFNNSSETTNQLTPTIFSNNHFQYQPAETSSPNANQNSNQHIIKDDENMTHHVTGLRKRPSLLRRSSKRESYSNHDHNQNHHHPQHPQQHPQNSFVLLCSGVKTPHSALNKSLDSLPEAEHLKANIKPLFEILKSKSNDVSCNNKLNQANRKKSTKKQNQTIEDFHWTRQCIKNPILDEVPKGLWKTCIKLFKTIQKFMGDRKTKKSPSDLVFLVDKYCVKDTTVRDEVFMQICKQTIDNPDKRSMCRGLELLGDCLNPNGPLPSPTILKFLEQHITLTLDNFQLSISTTDSIFVALCRCRDRIEEVFCNLSGEMSFPTEHSPGSPNIFSDFNFPRSNLRYRSMSQMLQAEQRKNYRANRSFFNQTLSCQMSIQKNVFPNNEVPLILSSLCTQIAYDIEHQSNFVSLYSESQKLAQSLSFSLTNHLTEAIHLIDNWCLLVCQKKSLVAPNLQIISLSVLIHWFTNLPEPIIFPQSNCVYQPINFQMSSLSTFNQAVLTYIIGFFHDHVISKSRDLSWNIASFLCPLIFQLPADQFYPCTLNYDSPHPRFVAHLLNMNNSVQSKSFSFKNSAN